MTCTSLNHSFKKMAADQIHYRDLVLLKKKHKNCQSNTSNLRKPVSHKSGVSAVHTFAFSPVSLAVLLNGYPGFFVFIGFSG